MNAVSDASVDVLLENENDDGRMGAIEAAVFHASAVLYIEDYIFNDQD